MTYEESLRLRDEVLPRTNEKRDRNLRRALISCLFLLFLILVIWAATNGRVDAPPPLPPVKLDSDEDDDFTESTSTPSNHSESSIYEEPTTLLSNLTVEDCGSEKVKTLVDEANCGTKYDAAPSSNPFRIAVVNPASGRRHHWRRTTGCPVHEDSREASPRGSCPLHPNCVFTHHDSLTQEVKGDVDAVMFLPLDAHAVSTVAPRRAKSNRPTLGERVPFRIIYDHDSASIPRATQEFFDLEMGIHYGAAAVVNPQFALSPHALWYHGGRSSENARDYHPTTEPERHTQFAVSIIYHCTSQSRRRLYLEALHRYLGRHRLHLYGETCEGLTTLPFPRGLRSLRELIERYKFHIVFEPVVQVGFITSKFFVSLTYDSIPVYLGPQHHQVNLTLNTRSYISINDFRSPKDLANRLFHLESHGEEYDEYFRWRESNERNRGGAGSEEVFTRDYLEYVAHHVPGPKELALHGGNVRLALCCRLCDRGLLREASASHRNHFVTEKMSDELIRKRYFGGE